MDEETKMVAVMLAGLALIAGIVAFTFLRSQAQTQETLRQCLQTQRPALECSAMVNGGAR